MSKSKPLVLDVDGTFLKTDMLFECFWAGLGNNPTETLRASAKHITKPAVLKAKLVELADLRTDLLPVNDEIKDFADEEIAKGREVVLASASNIDLVRRLAADHGLSENVLASEGSVNLKGSKKADALVQRYGAGKFDYAGNEKVDVPIWEVADQALVVGSHPEIRRDLESQGKKVSEFPGDWNFRDLIRALRPHQYVKNILLLLPLLASHDFTMQALSMALLGMVAFSAAASSIYIVNDLLDLEADRLHATKHRRPFASGAVPISVGMVTCFILGVVALGLGAWLGTTFLMVVMTYMLLSLAYSLRLKRMRWIDIAVLATLYTLRVIAGAAATQVEVSIFMLIFIFPVFINLGCVKRLTELSQATSDENLPGRGYGRNDRGDLLNIAALGIVGALVIFFLYSLSDQARELYPTQWILWVAMVPMALWLVRMLRLGYFGKQDYDPIVFALRDRRGLGLLFLVLSMMFYAAGIWQEWFGLVVSP